MESSWLSSSYTSRMSPRLLLVPNLSSAETLYVGNTISITSPHTFISRSHRPPNHPVSLSLASALPRRWRFSPYSSSSCSPSSYTPHGIGRPIPSSRAAAAAAASGGGGWLSVFGATNKNKEFYPDIVKAGDPVLHEPARDVKVEEIASDSIQKIVDDMIRVMRKAPGVGLAAPQIGVPLKKEGTLIW